MFDKIFKTLLLISLILVAISLFKLAESMRYDSFLRNNFIIRYDKVENIEEVKCIPANSFKLASRDVQFWNYQLGELYEKRDCKIKELYNKLYKEYELPDFEQFKKDMQDKSKRNTLRESLIKDGYDMPSEKQFEMDMTI